MRRGAQWTFTVDAGHLPVHALFDRAPFWGAFFLYTVLFLIKVRKL